MFARKFRRTKVADLTVGRALAYNFVAPIVQIAGYAVAIVGVGTALNKANRKSPVPTQNQDNLEE